MKVQTVSFEQAGVLAKQFFESPQWGRFVHEGTKPAYTSQEKKENAEWAKANNNKHCAVCLNMNGCCLPVDVIENKMKFPFHENCHCYVVPANNLEITAESPISKFAGYVFNEEKYSLNGKIKMFANWGYSVSDSIYLSEIFSKQAKLLFAKVNFELGRLDAYGQRIDIRVKLQRKDRFEVVSFVSGWMLYPDGRIVLTTPYGGK